MSYTAQDYRTQMDNSCESQVKVQGDEQLRAEQEFAEFSEQLALRLRTDYPLPNWQDPDFTELPPFVEPERSLCIACGRVTSFPVLCAACLPKREERRWRCPLYAPFGWCLAGPALDGHQGRRSGCAGLLADCHYPECLLALREDGE